MGAAGRDFHAFHTRFKNETGYEVVAFTATQIPGIDNKSFPYSLSGELYPNGIPNLRSGTTNRGRSAIRIVNQNCMVIVSWGNGGRKESRSRNTQLCHEFINSLIQQ